MKKHLSSEKEVEAFLKTYKKLQREASESGRKIEVLTIPFGVNGEQEGQEFFDDGGPICVELRKTRNQSMH